MNTKKLLIVGDSQNLIIKNESYENVSIVDGIYCTIRSTIYQFDNDRVIIGGENTFWIVFIDSQVSWIESSYNNSALGFVFSFIKLYDDETIICGCENGKMLQYNIRTTKVFY